MAACNLQQSSATAVRYWVLKPMQQCPVQVSCGGAYLQTLPAVQEDGGG